MFRRGPRVPSVALGAISRSIAPWCLLLLGVKLFVVLGWSPDDRYLSWSWWAWTLTTDLGDLLPYLAFAGGVAVVSGVFRRGFMMRIALPMALAWAALSYVLDAWSSPELWDRYLSSVGVEDAEAGRFGPETPSGIVRNLRFVEANPPDQYSLRMAAPHEAPPNVLRWQLHSPIAQAAFGSLSFLMGFLTAEATGGLRRGTRRNARLAVGVLGGLGFFGCVVIASPIPPFLRDGTMQSGILSAWAPLAFPLAQCGVLLYLARRRWHG